MLQASSQIQGPGAKRLLQACQCTARRAPDRHADQMSIMVQVADALHFLHAEASLVHCAIAPPSVVITVQGSWKLCGLALATKESFNSSDAHAHRFDFGNSAQPLWRQLTQVQQATVLICNSAVSTATAAVVAAMCRRMHVNCSSFLLHATAFCCDCEQDFCLQLWHGHLLQMQSMQKEGPNCVLHLQPQLAYTAPELAGSGSASAFSLGPAADIFSLGGTSCSSSLN